MGLGKVSIASKSSLRGLYSRPLTTLIDKAASSGPVPPSTDFIFEVQTDGPGKDFPMPTWADDSGFFPTYGRSFNYNYTVDWGDGSPVETVLTATAVHNYAAAGTHIITVKGLCECFASNFNNLLITRIIQWGNIGCLKYDFSSCERLTEIPDDLAGAFSLVIDVAFMFAYGPAISTIPAGLFTYATICTDFSFCFSGGSFYPGSFTSIPAGLVYNCVAATSFQSLFQQSALQSIDEDFFRYNINVTDFSYCFGYCPFTVLPENIFKYNVAVTTFNGVFQHMDSITSIPEGIFKYNVNALVFSGVFFNSDNIGTPPVDLFRYNTLAEDFTGCFSRTKITTVPEDLFKYNHGVFSFGSLFLACKFLTTVPAGLFAHNTLAEDFSGIFQESAIQTVPATLFANNPRVITFELAFNQCLSLQAIPATLFDGCPVVDSFKQTWSQCGGLTLTGPAPALWLKVPVASSHFLTFNSCTGLTNYASIPAGWK